MAPEIELSTNRQYQMDAVRLHSTSLFTSWRAITTLVTRERVKKGSLRNDNIKSSNSTPGPSSRKTKRKKQDARKFGSTRKHKKKKRRDWRGLFVKVWSVISCGFCSAGLVQTWNNENW
ncbi:hypothetical protein DL98DRAFT_237918 [Cadophora sp. DSE1049]|nr:hypothetical protein DL98DRAFT_237918 [Cadophora sp. DSE1049]